MSDWEAWFRPKRVIEILGVVLVVLATWWWFGEAAESQPPPDVATTSGESLDAVVAETDREDPDWRWGRIQASRPKIPDDQNGYVRLEATARAIPKDWPGPSRRSRSDPLRGSELIASLGARQVEVKLSQREQTGLAEELQSLGPALDLARALADRPLGQPPAVPDRAEAVRRWEQVYRRERVARLLWLDVHARADSGDLAGAARSCRAGLNAARAIGDDVGWWLGVDAGTEEVRNPQFARIAHMGWALRGIERLLAQGELPEETLAEWDDLLRQELERPLAVVVTRGLRALMSDVYERAESGALPLDDLRGELGLPGEPDYGSLADAQAINLLWLNQAVKVARMPYAQQASASSLWQQDFYSNRSHVYGAAGAFVNYGILHTAPTAATAAEQRYRAELSAMRALLALERHARRHGAWPASFDELDEALLARTPWDGLRRVERVEGGWTASWDQIIPPMGYVPQPTQGYLPQPSQSLRLIDPDRRGKP